MSNFDFKSAISSITRRLSGGRSRKFSEACGRFEDDPILILQQKCKYCGFSKVDHATGKSEQLLTPHPAYPPRKFVEYKRWGMRYDDYDPVEFTHDVVFRNDCTKLEGGWADPADPLKVEDLFTRTSLGGDIQFDKKTGRPLNPKGRQGYSGRGLLGKWGPNFAADAIVTRISPDGKGFEVVSIKRKDTGAWALPGGMVDAGEKVAAACKREFIEEAGNVKEENKEKFLEQIELLFAPSNARVVYQGIVQDPRNTDNAWMESTFYHFPCPKELAGELFLTAGDDACEIQWMPVDDRVPEFFNFYADHKVHVVRALQTAKMDLIVL